MKKLSFALFTLLCAVLITSCTGGSSTGNLLNAIPDDAAVVCVGDIKTILESAGGSLVDNKIKLPSDITDLMKASDEETLDELNDMLKNGGVDPNTVACFVTDFDKGRPVIVGLVKDKKKFIDYIEDNGFKEKDDDENAIYYTKLTYESSYSSEYNDYSYVALTDNYAYLINNVWVGSDFKPMKELRKIIDKTAENPYSKSPVAGYLTKGNAGGVAIKIPREARQELRRSGFPSEMLDLLNGYVCFSGNLADETATVNMKFFDEDGKEVDLSTMNKYSDPSAKINPKALTFLNKDQAFVTAIALKNVDWDEVMDAVGSQMSRSDRAGLGMVTNYLNKLDGTIAIGIGLTNGLESIFCLDMEYKMLDNLSFSLVAETKEGKAKSLVNDLTDLLQTVNMPYEASKNGLRISLEDQGYVYVEYVDNFIIVSNANVKKSGKNPTIENVDFSGIAAAGFYLDKNNKLMEDLDIKNDLKAALKINPKDGEYALNVQVKGGKGGILAKMLNIGLDIANQKDKIERKHDLVYEQIRETRRIEEPAYDYDYDYDYAYADSVLVEEAVVAE